MLISHLMAPLFKRVLFVALTAMLFSCNGGSNDYSACFGGEITNPSSPFVILSRDNIPVDTLVLDKDNRFFIKFDSLTPGLYSIQHEPDYQYVYFDKNDSIMMSANGNDFDNSLVFSGRGDRKNNFLAELYILNEKDRNESYEVYDYDYISFRRNIDSVYRERKAFYERQKAAINWSDGFDLFARIRTDMAYYTKKEYYPVVHARRTGNDIRAQLPVNFYDYRKTIDFENRQLSNFSPFVRYVNAMITNMAVKRSKRGNSLSEDLVQDNINKLEIADSVFRNENIRNNILNSIAFSYLLEDQGGGNNQKFLKRYMELSTDNSPGNEIRKIAAALSGLQPGRRLPEINLTDIAGKKPDIYSIKGQSVIFFWTSCARLHMEMVARKITALQREFPKTTFIAINVDEDKEWKQALPSFQLSNVLQLRAKDFKELKSKWAFTRINKTIIFQPGGRIENAFGNLTDPGFSALLR